MKSKLFACFIFIASVTLLIPGVYQPVLILEGSIEKAEIVEQGINMLAEKGDNNTRGMLRMFSGMLGLDKLEGDLLVYSKTRSILGTVQELSDKKNYLVAILVALFAIIVPCVKQALQLSVVLLASKRKFASFCYKSSSFLAKWSMADVFVIALIIAFLAGNADGQMGTLITMSAKLGNGFWFFTAYCLVSIASSQWITHLQSKNYL